MGFGLLFIGYLMEFVLELNAYGVFVYLLGYGLIYLGLMTLQLYCHTFRYARLTVIPLALLAAYRTLEGLGTMFSFSVPIVTDMATRVVNFANMLLVLLFHIFLALAIKDIATKTDVKRNASAAMRNMILVELYYAIMLPLLFVERVNSVLYAALLLLRLAWALLNCVLIYSCYMHICPANESEDKPIKPSRFAFVNRFRAEFQRREDKAIAEDRAYHLENARKRAEKRSRKNKK